MDWRADLFTPSLNVTREVKEAMNRAAKESGLSRDQIVDRMVALGGDYGINLASGNAASLTVAVLDKWLNPAETERMIPLKGLPVFCQVVKSMEPIAAMAAPLGGKVIGPEDVRLLEWAKLSREVQTKRKRLQKLEQELEG